LTEKRHKNAAIFYGCAFISVFGFTFLSYYIPYPLLTVCFTQRVFGIIKGLQ